MTEVVGRVASPPALTILQASPRAFCAGVERAIEIVDLLLDQRGAPIYVRKQIVHNVHVVGDLATRWFDGNSRVPVPAPPRIDWFEAASSQPRKDQVNDDPLPERARRHH